MIRRFKFEEAENQDSACVPMDIKRMLDRVGLKISRAQWGDLSSADGEAISALPAGSEQEIEAARSVISEIVLRTSGAAPAELPVEQRRLADPPARPPQQLVERAAELGFQLGDSQWKRLGTEQRYALTKLAIGTKSGRKLSNALREFGVALS
jgi:hypothetical protein